MFPRASIECHGAASLLAGLALLLSASVILGNYLWETRFDLSPTHPAKGSTNSIDSQEPVTVTLHEFSSETRTTGKSISFTFPKNYYLWAINAAGGSQLNVVLDLDRHSLEPLRPVWLRVLYDIGPGIGKKERLRAIMKHGLELSIHSSNNPPTGFTTLFVASILLQEHPTRHRLEICDFTYLMPKMYRRSSGVPDNVGHPITRSSIKILDSPDSPLWSL